MGRVESIFNSALRGVIQISNAFQGGTWDLWEVIRYASSEETASGQVVLKVDKMIVRITIDVKEDHSVHA